MSASIVHLSLQYTKVDHKATLSSEGHIHYGSKSLDSITEFCNEVTNNKASGQVTERVKFIVDGKERCDYGSVKDKVKEYHGKEKLKALYCLVVGSTLPTVTLKKEKKESKSSTSATTDPVKEILKQFNKLSLEDKGSCMKLIMGNYVDQVNLDSSAQLVDQE